MAQRKGETGTAYMNRLRAARGLPPMKDRDQLFEEMRGAKAFLSTGHHNRPGLELLAFMHIFHPDHPTTGSEELRRTAREMDRAARR